MIVRNLQGATTWTRHRACSADRIPTAAAAGEPPNQRVLLANADSVGGEHGALAPLSVKECEHPVFAFV